jgi:hypothetical protein
MKHHIIGHCLLVRENVDIYYNKKGHISSRFHDWICLNCGRLIKHKVKTLISKGYYLCNCPDHQPGNIRDHFPVQGPMRSLCPTYSVWNNMHQRCDNPKNRSYRYYGGRGITVCDRWSGEDGYDNFLKDMGQRPKGLEIDRIDVNKGYCKENCRWVTRTENNQNKRSKKDGR